MPAIYLLHKKANSFVCTAIYDNEIECLSVSNTIRRMFPCRLHKYYLLNCYGYSYSWIEWIAICVLWCWLTNVFVNILTTDTLSISRMGMTMRLLRNGFWWVSIPLFDSAFLSSRSLKYGQVVISSMCKIKMWPIPILLTWQICTTDFPLAHRIWTAHCLRWWWAKTKRTQLHRIQIK